MTRKAPARKSTLADASFAPRFDYGQMAQVAVITGNGEDATRLGSGFVRFHNAEIPWTIRYDEVILVLDGQLTLRLPEQEMTAGPMEVIWLPEGTQLTYLARSALVFYAIEPANWQER